MRARPIRPAPWCAWTSAPSRFDKLKTFGRLSLRGPEPAEGQLTREVRAPQAAAARPFSSLRLSRAPPPRRAARARGLRV